MKSKEAIARKKENQALIRHGTVFFRLLKPLSEDAVTAFWKISTMKPARWVTESPGHNSLHDGGLVGGLHSVLGMNRVLFLAFMLQLQLAGQKTESAPGHCVVTYPSANVVAQAEEGTSLVQKAVEFIRLPPNCVTFGSLSGLLLSQL